MHLSMTFKDAQETINNLHADASKNKPDGIYKELITFLSRIIDALEPDIIQRFFYLFQDIPHLFLALEVIDISRVGVVRERVALIDKPIFVISMEVELNTGDENNGEAVLDLFWSGTKYSFFRCGDSYKPGYYNNDEVKMFHCICNQLLVSWDNECKFYLKCLLHRGGKEVNLLMSDGRNIRAALDSKGNSVKNKS